MAMLLSTLIKDGLLYPCLHPLIETIPGIGNGIERHQVLLVCQICPAVFDVGIGIVPVNVSESSISLFSFRAILHVIQMLVLDSALHIERGPLLPHGFVEFQDVWDQGVAIIPLKP